MSSRRKRAGEDTTFAPFSPPSLSVESSVAREDVEEKPAIQQQPPPTTSVKEFSERTTPRPKTIYFSLAIVLVIVLVVSGILILIGIDNYNQTRAALPAGTAPPSLLKNPWILAGIVTAVLGAAAIFFASSAYSSKSKSSGSGSVDSGGGGELISGSESVGSQLEKLVQFAEQLGQSAQRLGRTVRQTQTAFSSTTSTGAATAPPLSAAKTTATE